MKFSIIIPVFNKALYVVDTVNSVLHQSFDDFEIIVIDDGSTDRSIDLIKRIEDPRVTLIIQENAGVAVARNRGLTHAKGEWVCFLDADDWQHPKFLEHIYLMTKKFSDYQVLATRFLPLPDATHWRPEPWEVQHVSFEIIQDLPSRWIVGIPFFTGSIAIKRQVLVNMPYCFEPGESMGEDLDLWFRLAEKHPIVLMQQPLVAYRTAISNSLSTLIKVTIVPPFIVRMEKRALNLGDQLKYSTLKYVNFYYITMARKLLIQGEKLKAVKILTQMWPCEIKNKRWWLTLFMALFIPGKLINAWEDWRKTRKYAKL